MSSKRNSRKILIKSPPNVHPYIKILSKALLLLLSPNIANHVICITDYRIVLYLEIFISLFNFLTIFYNIIFYKKYREVTKDKLMKIKGKFLKKFLLLKINFKNSIKQ